MSDGKSYQIECQFVRRGRVRFYVCLLLFPSPRPPLADWVSPGPAGPDPYARQSTNIFADYIFSDRISNRMPGKKHPKIICQIAAVPEEYLPHNMSDRMPTRISDKASVCMEGKTSE